MTTTELKLVLGHKPPLFDVPPGWCILTTDPDNKKDFYVEDDYVWTKNGDADTLSEYCYLIPLAKKLKSMPEIQTVRIAQYRKIVCNPKFTDSEGITTPRHFFTPKELEKYSIEEITKSRDNLLLSVFYEFPINLLHHYDSAHCIEDLLKFLLDAVKCGVIDNEQLVRILNSKALLVGGIGLGVYPKDVFVKILAQAEKAALFYYKESWIRRTDNYQYRNIGFLLEILTGYLVCKELYARGIDIFNSCGCLTIVDENKQYQPGTRQ
jgi:hypothetical protein